ILAVNLAHGSGYTAVCATVASEPQRIEKTNTEAVIGQIAIYDSDWKLVWGPHKVPELAWLPRVEAVTRSDGTQGFVFFGIFDHEPSETAPGLHAALLSLYASLVWVDDLDAPAPYLISDEILGTDEIW